MRVSRRMACSTARNMPWNTRLIMAHHDDFFTTLLPDSSCLREEHQKFVFLIFCKCLANWKPGIKSLWAGTVSMCGFHLLVDNVAERLRRWTANPLGSPCVGSNPIVVDWTMSDMDPSLRTISFAIFFKLTSYHAPRLILFSKISFT